jgi:hypothetical protein
MPDMSDTPVAPTLAGDPHDPDARVLDSLVEQHAAPPTAAEDPTGPPTPLVKPLRTTRLLTGAIKPLAAWGPILALPADDSRTVLELVMYSATATDVLYVADDPGKLQANGGALVMVPNVRVSLPGHTGPVWVAVPNAPDTAVVGPVRLTYAAVTV